MAISELVGNTLGLSEPSARFLLALFSAYPLAILYRGWVAGRSSSIQNVYFTVTGLAVLYYVYGLGVWHSLVDVCCVYMLLKMFGGSSLTLLLTWVISMGHLVCGYIYVMYSKQIHPIAWTIPHCVLVLKLIGVVYNVYDGRKKSETLSYEQSILSVKKTPSFLELMGFAYFFGSLLAGPQIPFKRHILFCEGHLFQRTAVPSSIPAAGQRLLVGVVFAGVYSLSNQFFPIGFLISEEFMSNSFALRLVYMVVCGKVALWRYISVWLIAEGSCMWIGISYERKDHKNELDVLSEDPAVSGCGVDSVAARDVSWHALTNVKIVDFELGVSLDSVVNCFNMNTNKWMLWYVFKRLRFLGNKSLSWVLTMALISLWHGVWPGYYITFSLEMLDIMAERALLSYCYRLFGRTLSEVPLPLRVLMGVAAWVVRNLLLLYPLTTFMLLDWASCYTFMSSMYFFVHVVVLGWLILYQVIPKPHPPKHASTTHTVNGATNGTFTNCASSNKAL